MRVATHEEARVSAGIFSHGAIDGGRLIPLRIVENAEIGEFFGEALDDICRAVGAAAVHHNEWDAAQPDVTRHERTDTGFDVTCLIECRDHGQDV